LRPLFILDPGISPSGGELLRLAVLLVAATPAARAGASAILGRPRAVELLRAQ
jgi:hypothetical protein